MKELHSAAALDEEIRQDARKKAEACLVNADDESTQILNGVNERAEGALKNAREAMNKRLALYEKNINASLPLEKQRYVISYVRDAVFKQINSCLDSLTEEKKLGILRVMTEKALDELKDKEIKLKVNDIDEKSAQKMIEGLGLKVIQTSTVTVNENEQLSLLKCHAGIILETADGSLKCRFTIDEKIKEIIEEHNYELSSVLFNGRIPE